MSFGLYLIGNLLDKVYPISRHAMESLFKKDYTQVPMIVSFYDILARLNRKPNPRDEYQCNPCQRNWIILQ